MVDETPIALSNAQASADTQLSPLRWSSHARTAISRTPSEHMTAQRTFIG